MSLSDLIPSSDQLKLLQGVEGRLLRRKRTGKIITLILAFAWFIIQFVLAAKTEYLQHIGLFFQNLVTGHWDKLIGDKGIPIAELTGMLVVVVVFGIYFLFRWTSFLLKESEEVFRYTFWIKEFQRVEETPGERFTVKEEDRLHLLHHDLMERLNERIPRLSLLDADSDLSDDQKKGLTSHIHIEGHYAVREKRKNQWVIHVMPRVRVGPTGSSSTLAHPAKYPLEEGGQQGYILDAEKYNQLAERVYANIATEVYRQIESDVKSKIGLFPTSYLRAVALFHEAEDFAKSNTIDAYDRAIDLYKDALGYFNIANIKRLTELLIRCPIFWRLEVKFQHMYARVHIGYAKCLIYRRQMSALTGRHRNPLFDISINLDEVIKNLEIIHGKMTGLNKQSKFNAFVAFLTFPKDSWFRRLALKPLQTLFVRQRYLLFDAYVVVALAHYYLGSIEKAREFLENAEAVAPQRSERDPLFLLSAGAIEPDLDREILLFQPTTEIAPNFQIAQYFLAYYSEMRFRTKNEIVNTRAQSVIDEYEKVLSINPGNVGVLAAQGYLYWLSGNSKEAKQKLEEGCEIKAIARETFIGELNYGLARIAAAEGRFNKSWDLYMQAISADPGVGACSVSASTRVIVSYYEYMVSDILDRYRRFRATVKRYRKGLLGFPDNEEVSESVLSAVHSFALNDYGNASFNYYLRFGDIDRLKVAIKAFEGAIEENPQNIVARYNLHIACLWWQINGDKESTVDHLQEVVRKMPTWQAAVILLTQSIARSPNLEKLRKEIHRAKGELQKQRLEAGEAESLVDKLSAEKAKTPIEDIGVTMFEQNESIYEEKIQDAKKRARRERDLVTEMESKVRIIEDQLSKQFRDAMGSVLENTKLSSLSEDLKIDHNGRGVSQLLANKGIKWERLEENDVEAIRAWAEVLSYNVEIKAAIKASEKLCHLVRHFFPEDFDTNLILNRVYDSLIGSPLLDRTDLKNPSVLANRLKGNGDPLSDYLRDRLSPQTRQLINDYQGFNTVHEKFHVDFANELNEIIQGESIYDERRFAHVTGADEIGRLAKESLMGKDLAWLNRLLLEEAYPHEIARSQQKDTFKEKVACIKRTRNIVRYWLAQDPVQYSALLWLRSLFDFDEQFKFLHRTIKLKPEHHSYYSLLGDCYYAKGDNNKAVENYQSAIKRNRRVGIYHSKLAEVYWKLKDWRSAVEEYEEAIRLEPDKKSYHNRLKLLLNDEGIAYFELGYYEDAIEKYKEAIKVDPSDAVIHSNLSLAWEKFREPGKGVKNLEEAISSLQKARELDPKNDEYAKRLDNLQRRKSIGRHFGEKALDRWPVVTPIAVEVASDLIPYVEDTNRGIEATFLDQLAKMRERIRETMGIKVPPIRVWGNEADLPDGAYVIMINEIPLVRGTISEEMRLFPGSVNELETFGVSGEKTVNPQTDDEAVWVSKNDWQKVEKAGYELWEFLEYMVRHLEAVIRINASEFVGHKEVMDMLESQLPEIPGQINENSGNLSTLVSVLRGLLNEGVSITNLEMIVERFLQLKEEGMIILDIIETIRSMPKVRLTLAGNNEQYSFYKLGPALEGEIDTSINREGPQPVLTMETDKCQDILRRIREKINSQSYVSLLVEKTELRPFVRELTSFEWPRVPVLSRKEMLSELEDHLVGVIDMA